MTSNAIPVNKARIKDIVLSLPTGRTASIKFLKRNGEERLIRTVVGIDFGVSGSGAPYDAREKGIVFVYDVDLAQVEEPEDCWRAVRLDSVLSVETENKKYLLLS
jgi:hypothetical protein